ncbi:indolepyruvate ferredoxin oxidoreductase [uncultured archaeon]|nr:indolepyruvate ferredoxin oxidoreductase [uncultured archaeon]
MLKPENLADNMTGEVAFLLGNEAVARGLVESGVRVATTYPGTPSSEVGDTIARFARKSGIYFQYSVNEKVAYEIAYAASLSGKRSFTFMKVVGMNVAADSLMTSAYTGVEAGLVIMTADDPSMFSSQNEQDNRHFSDLAHIPLIEPSSPQEAKDFLKHAFELSEAEKLPVLFRTTTRVSHQRAPVTFGDVASGSGKSTFKRNIPQYLPFQPYSSRMKNELMEKMARISRFSDETVLNQLERKGSGKTGVIVSGAAYGPLIDVVNEHDLDVSILKLGLVNPLPEKLVLEFLGNHKEVVVVEELDPFVETKIRSLAQMNGITTSITGKLDGVFPSSFEYTQNVIAGSLSKILPVDAEHVDAKPHTEIPSRPPVMCPGCPHRGTYYAVKRAVGMSKIENVIYPSDIGCYSLGVFEPFEMSDVLLSMGSSIGTAQGFALSAGQTVISFIGDSTFFHAGMPSLVNAVHNGAKMILVILDNAVTAMTGQQPNPGSSMGSLGDPAPYARIEDLVASAGVEKISIVDPFDIKSTMRAVTEGLHFDGLSVIIARRECAIYADQKKKKIAPLVPYYVDKDKCTSCRNCVEKFSCPAISVDSGTVSIDPKLCDGCGLCSEIYVCPFRAIKSVEA